MRQLEKEAESWKNRYLSLKHQALNPHNRRIEKSIKVLLIALLLGNFLLVFTPLYIESYKYIPNSIASVFQFFNISLVKIEAQMLENGDVALLQKYYLFSLINVSILIASISLTIFLIAIEPSSKSPTFLRKYSLYFIVAILFLLSAVLLLNDAGYQTTRFPVYPAIGKGSVFFIRDTFFYYIISWALVEFVIIVKMITKRR